MTVHGSSWIDSLSKQSMGNIEVGVLLALRQPSSPTIQAHICESGNLQFICTGS